MKNIELQFTFIAEEYDKNRKKFIPCFDDFYIKTTAFIAANISEPKRILDLGAGTRLLLYFWFEHFPSSEYLLVDIAEDMLEIAEKRFKGLGNVKCRTADYSKGLPEENFDVMISALSVHHLENDEKKELFSRIYEALPENGLFINYDQFCAGEPEMNKWFDSYWEKCLSDSGLTEHDIDLWIERRKLDRECSVEQEMQMLYESGFKKVSCVYSCRKFAVIIAEK